MIAVQVNGKLSDTCEMDRDTEETQLKEIVFGLEKVTKHTRRERHKKGNYYPEQAR